MKTRILISTLALGLVSGAAAQYNGDVGGYVRAGRWTLNNSDYNPLSGFTQYCWFENKDFWGGGWNYTQGGYAPNGIAVLLSGRLLQFTQLDQDWSAFPRPLANADGNGTTYTSWSFTDPDSNNSDWQYFWEIWLHDGPVAGNNVSCDIMIHPRYNKMDGDYAGNVYLSGMWWERRIQYVAGYEIAHYYAQDQTNSLGLCLDDFWDNAVSVGWANGSDTIGCVWAGLEVFNGSGSWYTTQYDLNTY